MWTISWTLRSYYALWHNLLLLLRKQLTIGNWNCPYKSYCHKTVLLKVLCRDRGFDLSMESMGLAFYSFPKNRSYHEKNWREPPRAALIDPLAITQSAPGRLSLATKQNLPPSQSSRENSVSGAKRVIWSPRVLFTHENQQGIAYGPPPCFVPG